MDHLNNIAQAFSKGWAKVQEQAKAGKLAAPQDRRFSGNAWESDQTFLMLAHYYQLSAQALESMVEAAQVDDETRARLRFSAMQWIEAIAPSNFFFTNPVAIQKAIETNGQSVAQGIKLLLEDLQKGRLTQTDETAFEVGVNIAATPGQVVYQNPIMQLIQYAPVTPTVAQRPLLIVPPCINKYYILDLQEHNSFVRYAVENGFTVFMVSWRNPQPTDTDNIQQATWGDYLQHGVLDALHVVQQITGQPQVNTLGFCVGGTMLSQALALAQAQGNQPASSLTLLTSFLDFSNTGVMDVFVDEVHASVRDMQFANGGLMTARELATTFSFLRPSELVWNYVSSSYLMGVSPSAFDLLYWNSDGTNLPGAFFAWYFRNTYLENNFVKPDGVAINGHALKLDKLNMPAYVYGSRDDHIVPWKGAFNSIQALGGSSRFVLGASGHIAGVINPPSRNRRSYWAHGTAETNTDKGHCATDWLAAATEYSGSWWPDWIQWLTNHSGSNISAPGNSGSKQFPPLEPAPGSYVKVRAV